MTALDYPNCVLVVEDDPHVLKLIVTFLTRNGYRVIEAHNGREALEHMKAGQVNLVVLDLMMPDVSGWDVLKERAADPELLKIPVIVATANAGPDVAAVLDQGICALLPKPFDLGSLDALVKSCLAPRPEEQAEKVG